MMWCSLAIAATDTKELLLLWLFMIQGRTGMCLAWLLSSGVSLFDAEPVTCVAALIMLKTYDIWCSLAIAATKSKELLMWLLFMIQGSTGMCLAWMLSSTT